MHNQAVTSSLMVEPILTWVGPQVCVLTKPKPRTAPFDWLYSITPLSDRKLQEPLQIIRQHIFQFHVGPLQNVQLFSLYISPTLVWRLVRAQSVDVLTLTPLPIHTANIIILYLNENLPRIILAKSIIYSALHHGMTLLWHARTDAGSIGISIR